MIQRGTLVVITPTHKLSVLEAGTHRLVQQNTCTDIIIHCQVMGLYNIA